MSHATDSPIAKRTGALLLALFLAAATLLFAGVDRANAAVISKSAAFEIKSASLSNGYVYWFQRRSAEPRTWRQYSRAPGRVVRRALSSNVVEAVYEPPAGNNIVAFAVRGGRVAVGLASSRTKQGRTAVVEIVHKPEGPTATTLLERFGGKRDGKCDARAKLINIESTGAIVVEDSFVEGRTEACELVRRQGQFRALNPDGTQTDLTKRTSGWARSIDRWDSPMIKAGLGDWYAISTQFASDFFGASGFINLHTGELTSPPLNLGTLQNIEFSASGRALMRIDSLAAGATFYATATTAAQLNDPTPIRRARALSWIHICGDKLLEISRRKPTRKAPKGGGMWNLHLRTMDGAVERRLPQRLRRATAFDTCNATTAVFHRGLRKGRARQFTVPLG